ncbi:MAG: hypothetical protein JJ974_12135, partial [Phycisphaerales bacterium]|nr:hypothetical protein [Phycisphaerales bacterium]
MHNQSHTNTPHQNASTSTDQSPVTSDQSLTEQLLEDLLDPALTPILICQIHGLTLSQLANITQSDDYQSAIAAITTINQARQTPIKAQLHLQSLATLRDTADLAHQAALNSCSSPV